MRQFGGGEPLVGEIVGLRTFRVDDSGLLLPLYSSGCWYDGPNTATCAPPTGHHHRGPHTVPDDACECGFYAYGSVEAARQNKQMRYVQAVVACWGGVVAGTQGVRAEHARILALWVKPGAPTWVRKRVAVRYPSARLFDDPDAMVAEYPPTRLNCYAPPPRRHPSALLAGLALLATVLVLGTLPLPVLRHTDVLWALWLVATLGAGALTAWLVVGSRDAGHFAAAFIVAGLVGWLVAPLFGVAGWVLRVPLLRGLVVAAFGYLVTLWPRHFPVVRNPREPAFCGVRP